MPPALCMHLMMNGRSCRALALKGGRLCYFHNMTHTERRAARRIARRPAPASQRPTPELLARIESLDDLHVIQQALSLLFTGLVDGTLGLRRARPMLRALDLASRNAARADRASAGTLPHSTALALIDDMAARPATIAP